MPKKKIGEAQEHKQSEQASSPKAKNRRPAGQKPKKSSSHKNERSKQNSQKASAQKPQKQNKAEKQKKKCPYQAGDLQKDPQRREHRESLEEQYRYTPTDKNPARDRKVFDAFAYHDQTPVIGIFFKYFPFLIKRFFK